jgi:hypothetical protein
MRALIRPAGYLAAVLVGISIANRMRPFDAENALAGNVGQSLAGLVSGIKSGSVDQVKGVATKAGDQLKADITNHVTGTVLMGTVAGVAVAGLVDALL